MRKVTKLLLVVMAIALIFSLVGVAGAELPNIYTSVVYTGEAVYGYNEGFDIGYGESVSFQFDVLEASVGARWAFFVTENDVTADASGGHNYKGKSTNVLGFSTTAGGGAAVIMDWFGGTSYGKSYTAGTFFQAGNSYKFVYTTASDAASLDGMMEIFICPTANVGTSRENWECYMYQRNFGDTSNATWDFHPTNNVCIGLWTNGGAIDMKLGNVKVFSSEGLNVDETALTGHGAISVENVRPMPVGEATTNAQIYMGEYAESGYDGMAHIFFGTTTNPEAEYGIMLTTSENVSYIFEGKAIGTTGKYGIAIYNIPDGDYTACAYVGPGDNRTFGENTYFTAGKATYTVTYDLNGAEGSITSETVAQGTVATEPADDAVTLKGANLMYWADENGNEYDFATVLTKDITLTPVFESKYGGEVPKKYITTGAQYIGVSQDTAITLGDTVTWQFDVLAFSNAQAIRLVVSSGNAQNGTAMAYKNNTGVQSQIMGFTATNANDWYGGNMTKNKNKSNLFLSGYSYKLVYNAPSATYTANASFILYECSTADVGTSAENWVEVMKTTPFGNTEGGNGFAPYTVANMYVYIAGAGSELAIANSTIKVNSADAVDAPLYVSNGVDWDYAPYVKYGTSKRVLFTNTGWWGYNGGADIGYGGEMAMQFDVISASVTGRWAFTVTNDNLNNNPRSYKDPYQGQVMGYVSTASGAANVIGDWYGGAITTSRKATTAFVAGNTYKLVYKAATGEATADATMILYECPTSFVGTPLESWVEILATKGFDNSGAANGFSPVTGVNICLWSNAANGVDLVVDNAFVTASNGLKAGMSANVNVVTTPQEYVEPTVSSSEMNVDITSTGVFGFFENGLNMNYGDSVTWSFDVTKVDKATANWGFAISEGDVKADLSNVTNYKSTFAVNRFFWNGNASDYLTGTMKSAYKYYNALEAGKTYKLVYTAPSSASTNDGSLIFYSCPTADVGTASETWAVVGSLTAFGNNNASGYKFAPMSNVKFGFWSNGAQLTFTMKNSALTFSNGSTLTDISYYGSTNVVIG